MTLDPQIYRAWVGGVSIQSMHLARVTAQSNLPGLDPETVTHHPHIGDVILQSVADGVWVGVVTVTVTTSWIVGKRPTQPGAPESPGSVELTFAVLYNVPTEPPPGATEIFKSSVVTHVWPMARDRIRTITSDFGWPPVVLQPWVSHPLPARARAQQKASRRKKSG